MTTMSVRLPNSLHRAARDLAKAEGISINQLMTSALAEKLSALKTVDYLEQRAKAGSMEEFRAIMARVPNVPPDPHDSL